MIQSVQLRNDVGNHTVNACKVCGGKRTGRVRMVLKDDVGNVVVNVCSSDCWRKFFGVPHDWQPIGSAGKVYGKRMLESAPQCRWCAKSAEGGVFVSPDSRFREMFAGRKIVFVCEECIRRMTSIEPRVKGDSL